MLKITITKGTIIMNDQNTNEQFDVDMIEIDLLDLARLLWKKLWLIVICMVLCGSIAFSAAMFSVEQTYTATGMMYVNNSSVSLGSTSITFSTSQLSAAKSLLDVYVIIMESRTSLKVVQEEAAPKLSRDYSIEELRAVISAASVNNTEIFSISATCSNPEDAMVIVNTVMDVLPAEIGRIVLGSDVVEVDRAVLPQASSTPSNNRYALIGAVIGAILGGAIIIIQDLMNTTVRDEEYLKQRYNIPILAIVPDAYNRSKKSYYKGGYKYAYKGYYGHSGIGYYARAYEHSSESDQTGSGDK